MDTDPFHSTFSNPIGNTKTTGSDTILNEYLTTAPHNHDTKLTDTSLPPSSSSSSSIIQPQPANIHLPPLSTSASTTASSSLLNTAPPMPFHPPTKAPPSFNFQSESHQPLHILNMLQSFWQSQYQAVGHQDTPDYKNYQLPLARIKKIMRIEEDVRMISGEAPVIFSKACELFILELTLRSWALTEGDSRRTLQLTDLLNAAGKSEMYDFLIDVLPIRRGSGAEDTEETFNEQ